MSSAISPLDDLLAKAGQLYSLPAVAMQVLELTGNPRVDLSALKQCIENDPALTTKVLRVVNSSLFGLSREVSDLNQALALLGIKPLKLLVLGFSLPQQLFEGVAGDVLGRYWRHALTKAVAAREISQTLGQSSGDEAFIAGLLQDLGILLLIQHLGDPYLRFLEKVHASGGDLAALETQVIGFDHTVLTSRLLDHWNLPDVLVQAVPRQPACDAATPPGPLAPILEMAELAARLLAEGRTDALGQLLSAAEGSHGVDRECMEELLGSLQETVEQLADVLSLRLPEGRSYLEVLAQAHAQLAEVAAEAAEDLIRPRSADDLLDAETADLVDELRALYETVAQGRSSPQRPKAAPPGGQPTRAPVAVESVHGPTDGSPGRQSPATARASRASEPVPADADPGLLGQLSASISACRKSHSPLTLLLVEIDDVEDLLLTSGVEGLEKIRLSLETACKNVDQPHAICLPHRDMGFALVLPDCERQGAVRLANQLADQVRQTAPDAPLPGRPPLSISAGAATLSVPTRNFPPLDLLIGAQRCLYGSQASGVVVKSIEIY